MLQSMGSQIIRHKLAAEHQGEIKKDSRGTSLVAQCLTIHLPVQGTQAQSLVRELRSHMLQLRPSQINKYLKKKKNRGSRDKEGRHEKTMGGIRADGREGQIHVKPRNSPQVHE